MQLFFKKKSFLLHLILQYGNVDSMGIKEEILYLLYLQFLQQPRYLTYNFLYSFFSTTNRGAIRVLLGRLKREGFITQIIKKIHDQKVVYFSLSEAGRVHIEHITDILGKNRQWDGKWRMVVLVSKKALRDNFLQNNGLVKLDKSTYVGCYPLSFALDPKLGFVFEAKEVLAYTNKQLAYFVWRIDKVEKLYKEVFLSIKSKKDARFVLKGPAGSHLCRSPPR